LSKVDNIFNPKQRETKIKLMQARTKILDEFVNLFLLNYVCKHWDYFSRFFQKRLFGLRPTWFMIWTAEYC